VSDRSDAWYAVPENRERRKARMRAYVQASFALGRMFPGERKANYPQARDAGKASGPAQTMAMSQLRAAHPTEFRTLYEEKLTGESPAAQSTE
jgi:hypothetical protein